jgi:type IV secretion system protein VirB9
MRNIFFASMFTLLAIHSGVSAAESFPRSVTADRHVKVVMYDPNNVVMLQGRYGYQTQITFSPTETVQSVSIGDSLAWQAVPVANHLFIKPVASSNTNMSVLTNSNSYNFQLDSQHTQIKPTYKLQFTYPESGYDSAGKSSYIGSFDPGNINWRYSFTGERSLVPSEVFDNGKFTFFKFKTDGVSRIPSVFIVDQDKSEMLINYHMQGDYMVIHNVAKQFTLRDGSSVTNIYNDYAIGDWKNI